ncbi:MAG TPA: sulfotransferase [Oleiagrimonas sp.]|nr:sulfotransferase [Oleiagrimonas sp.]
MDDRVTQKDTLPNLFLVGAPKCGTTAMSTYLAGHPDVFMSEQSGVKEPNFFCADFRFTHQRQSVVAWTDYLELFHPAPGGARYRGEASTFYILSQQAIPDILDSCPDPRFVVMLRNPVDMVVSLHNQKIKNRTETAPLEEAWALQPERRNGEKLPPRIDDGRFLDYSYACTLGAHLERLYRYVPRANVHCVFFDEFKDDPSRAYRGVLKFLSLPDDHRKQFDVVNKSMQYKHDWIETAVRRLAPLRARAGLPRMGIHTFVNKFNQKSGKAAPSANFLNYLAMHFRDDIELLARITGRDLGGWYAKYTNDAA